MKPGKTRQDPAAIFHQAQQLQQAGNHKNARECYERLLKLAPGHPQVLHFLGLTWYQTGSHQRAITLMRKSIDIESSNPLFHNNIGLVYRATGEYGKAGQSFSTATRLAPDYADAWYNLGLCHEDLGQFQQALVDYRTAIRLRPDFLKPYHNLGLLLTALGYHYEAEEHFLEALKIDPVFPGFIEGLISLYQRHGRTQDADQYLKKLENIQHEGEPSLSLAKIYRLRGQFDKAKGHYQQLLVKEPASVAARVGLLQVQKADDSSKKTIRDLEKALGREDLMRAERTELCFALGKAFSELADYDKAFHYFRLGNDLKNEIVTFDRQAESDRVNRIIESFTPELIKHRTSENPSKRPIFILGMPRSATTLVEQIVSSHSDVMAGGELPVMSHVLRTVPKLFDCEPYPAFTSQLGSDEMLRIADLFESKLDLIDERSKHITDKVPFNYMHIGLIHMMFPEAAIIHCKRDAMDVCLSNYLQNFEISNPFSFNLENIAYYYRLYESLMEHWERVLPGRFLTVEYDELVNRQEESTRRLLAHCGLEWDEACLRFYESERAVMTASTSQVRQPVYRTSVNKWKHFESHLQPLKLALGYHE